MRDCSYGVFPMRAKWIAKHCRIFCGPDDSKTAKFRFHVWPEMHRVFDHAVAQLGSCDRRRQVRWPASPTRNRNRGRKHRSDAAAGIFIRQNFDSAAVAKGCAEGSSHFCGGNARGSRRYLRLWRLLRKLNQPLILVRCPERGKRRIEARVVIGHPAIEHVPSVGKCASTPPLPCQRAKIEVRDWDYL